MTTTAPNAEAALRIVRDLAEHVIKRTPYCLWKPRHITDEPKPVKAEYVYNNLFCRACGEGFSAAPERCPYCSCKEFIERERTNGHIGR